MKKIEANILVIDDDADILTSARLLLKQYFTKVETEKNASNIIHRISSENFDVIMLDMNLRKGLNDGGEGLYWLSQIPNYSPNTVCVLMTAYGEVELAVKAMKRGAFDFVVKPWENEKLVATITAALTYARSKRELENLKSKNDNLKEVVNNNAFSIIGQSKGIQKIMEIIEKISKTDVNVLILGENGTGKDLIAREIHQQSLRKDGIYLAVDMGSISENLFESELFGYEKGAFTDAKTAKPGRFELAAGGTLFLDEIGNLSMPMQSKLLTVIQHQSFYRLGSNKNLKPDFRLICATNMPLFEMVKNKEFRQDLLYRINTVEIHLPPLRERSEDIPLIIEHYLKIYTSKYKKEGLKVDAESLPKIMRYHWPGNIRELQHALERAVILCDGNTIKAKDLINEDFDFNQTIQQQELAPLSDMEKQAIQKSLEKHDGNVSRAAKDLGLTRASLYRRMEKYGI